MALFPNLSKTLKTLTLKPQTRTYISSMRKSAFTESILRYLRLSYPPTPSATPPPPPTPFSIHHLHGDRCVRLIRAHHNQESIQIDATIVNGDNDDRRNDIRSCAISVIVEVLKGECDIVLQFVCSAWNGRLDVENVVPVRKGVKAMQSFMGPEFREMDEELQSAVREYLEERGVNDELAEFLHEYMEGKHKQELVRWLKNVESCIKK